MLGIIVGFLLGLIVLHIMLTYALNEIRKNTRWPEFKAESDMDDQILSLHVKMDDNEIEQAPEKPLDAGFDLG